MSKWSDSEQKETMAILGVLFPVTAALYFELPASSAVDLPLLNASALLHPFFAAISICWGGSLVCMMASRLPIGKSNQLMWRDFALLLLVVVPLVVGLYVELSGVYFTWPFLAPMLTPALLVGVAGIFALYLKMIGSTTYIRGVHWIVRRAKRLRHPK